MKDEVLEYRKKHSLSQRAFAKLCGVSPTTILRLESGKEPMLLTKGKIEKVIKENK